MHNIRLVIKNFSFFAYFFFLFKNRNLNAKRISVLLMASANYDLILSDCLLDCLKA